MCVCGSFPLQNHAQRWWDFMILIERVKQQEQNKTKNRKKKCIMRRKRKQYRLRFDWKSLENCLHFINTVLTIK